MAALEGEIESILYKVTGIILGSGLVIYNRVR